MTGRTASDWLLAGDVSIQYQTRRDLLRESARSPRMVALRERIAREGWGARFLSCRNADGTWGRGFYQPKWISSHYTLLDLRNLCIAPNHQIVRESVETIIRRERGEDGGVNPARSIARSDVCVNGMFLNYACYFGLPQQSLESVIDFVLAQRIADGGFNCRLNRSGATHSSMHSTVCVLEGIAEYDAGGYTYRLAELREAAAAAQEFLLKHRLYRSDRTGEVIDPKFLRLAYPYRWKYSVLRALDAFRSMGAGRDSRMDDALKAVMDKRRPDGRWPLNAAWPGQTHFVMEEPRRPSRWNTLIALRVLSAYGDS